MKLPESVEIGDITIRDGLQALEHLFTTEQELALVEDIILCGFKHVEVTNFGHPKYLPQFADAEALLDRLFDSERVGHLLKQNGGDVTVTTVTINERAVDTARTAFCRWSLQIPHTTRSTPAGLSKNIG